MLGDGLWLVRLSMSVLGWHCRKVYHYMYLIQLFIKEELFNLLSNYCESNSRCVLILKIIL